MNYFFKFILLLLLIIINSNAYPTCQTVQINGYLYDLSKLPSSYLFVVQDTISSFVDFSFCQTSSCQGKKAFVLLKQDKQCYRYTNQLNPMKDNYSLIDSSAPKKGITINYLPFYDNDTSTYRNTALFVHCPAVFATNNYCKITNKPGTNTSIECHIGSDAACATIKLNYFWQFLYDKAIIFAILLWIMALFELLFGYLAIRMTIFIFGILSGAIFGIIYTAQNYVNFIYESEGYGIAVFVVCLSFLMGILFGISLLTLPRLGYINIGLWVAVIFSLLLQNSVLYLTGSLLAFYITVGVVGFIMTAIALMKLKNYIILSTSFISSFWLVRPLGFFLPYYPNQFLSGESYLLNSSTNWQFYLYLISIIVLTILGAVFQFCCFKKSASGNQSYYLEEQGSLKQKFKKLLQFEQIRHFIRTGKDQLKFFKQLIVDDSQAEQTPKAKNNKKSIAESQQQENQYKSVQFSDDQKPAQRKKTKLQRQMQDYQSKKARKQQEKKVSALFPQKSKQKASQQSLKRNRKIIQVPIQQDEQDENKKQQDQQSEDIKPNKLIVTNKKRNK